MTSETKCAGCGWKMTWAEQRRQYGRLLRAGMSESEAKATPRRCQKCTTILKKTLKAENRNEAN